ncbi:MAG: 1-deoxy-D-xylulose-5-phosphate reductoisomerase, partial [Clostridia bacterium]|nr:1-deoxy-D-xylulose-5-phosphate reductoisomerase [Clostridia bacterium]
MKKIAVLGCTGSIGKTTLSIFRKYREDFRVVLLANFTRENELYLLKKDFPDAETY